MEIKLATLDDINPICKLYNEFFAYNAKLQPAYYKEGTETGRYPRSVIEDKNSDIFIAVEHNMTVGFIHVKESQTPPFDAIVPHKYAEVNDFIVTASYRNQGIGSMLMDAAKQWGKKRDLAYIELFVLSEAKDEILFYERSDFTTVSHTMRCTL